MKKLVYLALSLTLGVSVANAQTTAPAAASKVVTNGPAITFVESKHDFGNIKQGDVVEYTFNFKNTGNQPLLISDVGVTCGCTATDYTKEPVAPGKSGFVKAKFNSAYKSGMQNKIITIKSNATAGDAQVAIISNVIVPTEASAKPTDAKKN
ncbi:hypothetical protein AHMF7605_04885 [Adhaeribacter arboris]|uniref:DUF1573 domain-containing protein n=1 Tax=Adhaeribacter arboris TaxID=2072846 RepID=A0A2T2YBU4_9BACT|nr:DUF1573 domain-containing protein [Adhaeribacter arboris]PSR52908.1 hypothetical protein AHMF7605_04885 [Adhaeribacter arboris]